MRTMTDKHGVRGVDVEATADWGALAPVAELRYLKYSTVPCESAAVFHAAGASCRVCLTQNLSNNYRLALWLYGDVASYWSPVHMSC